MIINNKIDKVFGPSGVFAGYVLMTVGLISSFYYPTALILLVIGGYTAFTTSGTIIDTDKKRIKHYISHFGLLKSGKWLELESFTGIQISRSNISYSTFSRSNRQLDTKKKGYRILLVDKNKKAGIPLMHCKSLDDAKVEAERLSKSLALPVEILQRNPGRHKAGR